MTESIKQRTGGLSTVGDALELRKLFEATRDELVLVRELANETKTAFNNLYNILDGRYLLTTPSLGIGSTVQNVANIAFYYSIGGEGYIKAAVAAGTAPGNDVIPQGKYGAVAFDIGSDGTIDAIEATGNATGFTSAALAAAAIPAAASGHARLGYVTAMKSDGAFTFGTTALNAANTTVAYTNGPLMFGAVSLMDAIAAADTAEYLGA